MIFGTRKRVTRLMVALFLSFSCFSILWMLTVNSLPNVPSQTESAPLQTESARVLVIANRNSPVSLRVAQYYMRLRGIPNENFLTLNLPDSSLIPIFETISYSTYQERVERVLRDFLNRKQLVNQIRYIVLTKGIPLRVKDVTYSLAKGETLKQNQSLDSTLAALDYKIPPIAFKDMEYKEGKEAFGMLTPNLYWRQTYPFEHRLSGGYLVSRLDGYSEADARALVDRALTQRSGLSGTVLLDPFGSNESSDDPQVIDVFDPKFCTPQVIPHCTPLPKAMVESYGKDYNNDLLLSERLVKGNFPQLQVILAPSRTFASGQNLIAYASWGSNDKFFDLAAYRDLQFLAGGIAETVVSSSGRTFFPTQHGQSLIGDLIANKRGVTGVRGYTDEPELQGIGSPTILFSNYLKGSNLAISYYRSIRFIGWRDLVLGDPLASVTSNK
jgi:hypothetical protein